MRIVHLSYALSGGAGRACVRLHEALLGVGIDSMVAYVQGAAAAVPASEAIRCFSRQRRMRFERLLLRMHARRQIFSSWSNNILPVGFIPELLRMRPDVVHIHWVGGGLLPTWQWRRLRAPIVVTLHDMQPFTGGCHFTCGCQRFIKGCGRCPQLGSNRTYDISRLRVWLIVSTMADMGVRLAVVAPSDWMARSAVWCFVFRRLGCKVEKIGYCLDLDRFCPGARVVDRQRLGLRNDDTVILAGAAGGMQDQRKGLALMPAIMDLLARNCPKRSWKLLSFGGTAPPWEGGNGWRSHHIGNIDDDTALRELYSVSDLCVVPSIEDNSPLVAHEALACGCPLVSSRVGGVPELVQEGHTGALAEFPEAMQLAQAVLRAVLAEDGERWRVHCREFALANFAPARQGERYCDVYRRLMKRNDV